MVPIDWFAPNHGWELLPARRWHWPLPILEGEARSANIWFRIVVSAVLLRRVDVLDLGDNSATVAGFTKGRATAPNLNAECHRKAALEGATDVRFGIT